MRHVQHTSNILRFVSLAPFSFSKRWLIWNNSRPNSNIRSTPDLLDFRFGNGSSSATMEQNSDNYSESKLQIEGDGGWLASTYPYLRLCPVNCWYYFLCCHFYGLCLRACRMEFVNQMNFESNANSTALTVCNAVPVFHFDILGEIIGSVIICMIYLVI